MSVPCEDSLVMHGPLTYRHLEGPSPHTSELRGPCKQSREDGDMDAGTVINDGRRTPDLRDRGGE